MYNSCHKAQKSPYNSRRSSSCMTHVHHFYVTWHPLFTAAPERRTMSIKKWEEKSNVENLSFLHFPVYTKSHICFLLFSIFIIFFFSGNEPVMMSRLCRTKPVLSPSCQSRAFLYLHRNRIGVKSLNKDIKCNIYIGQITKAIYVSLYLYVCVFCDFSLPLLRGRRKKNRILFLVFLSNPLLSFSI